MERKSDVMDEQQLRRSLARIAHEIIEKNNGAEEICLLGIKRRGITLAKLLRENIEQFEGRKVPCGWLDISLYRDDLSELSELPVSADSYIPVEPSDCHIIIVDDVLYTGRTARAAIDLVFKKGRPKSIQLAILIDRGHRELPIRPDYIGKNIPTSRNEVVKVFVEEYDGRFGVSLCAL